MSHASWRRRSDGLASTWRRVSVIKRAPNAMSSNQPTARRGPGGRRHTGIAPVGHPQWPGRSPRYNGPPRPPRRLRACAPTPRQETRVKLQEYRSKEILARHGVPLLDGEMATTPAEARAAAERIGGPVVVKAQVLVGGRGKAGGVKLASSAAEAEVRAREIIGLDIKGITVRTVLVAPAAEIAKEYYLGLILDRAARAITVIASGRGRGRDRGDREDESRCDPPPAAPSAPRAPGARGAAHRLLPRHPRRAAEGLRHGHARPVRRLRRVRCRPGRDQPAGRDR